MDGWMGGVGVPSSWLTFPMPVDTVNARRASIARMPGSQAVRKMERQRAHERGQTGGHSSVSAKTFSCPSLSWRFSPCSRFTDTEGDATNSECISWFISLSLSLRNRKDSGIKGSKHAKLWYCYCSKFKPSYLNFFYQQIPPCRF